ncbi:MAG: molybdenum ABC transporter ATP-binding protein, partial [Rhizobiaceae bacterium]|nr:molybdenum ABC transporter ATP-binding protein [Rhizobiaceae bacterium]
MISVDVEARLGEFELKAKLDAPGKITALFGPSGSGKTSLVRMIAGLEKPQKGTIQIGERVLFSAVKNINLPPRKRRVGYVFQDANLFPHFSVKTNLTYCEWAGGRKGSLGLDAVCEVLGIEHLLMRAPATLSGGEKQRVAIGRALLSDPSVLLLDEPLSALDTKRKLEILPFLEGVRDEFNLPMIYISHSVDEVTRLADYLVVLEEGKVSACGAIEDVLGDVELRGAGDGLEAGSLLKGVCSGFDKLMGLAKIEVAGQDIYLPIAQMEAGQKVRLRIKANDIALALSKPEGTSIQNMVECEIISLAQKGPSHIEVGLKIGEQQMRSRITRKAADDLALVRGAKCIALIKAVALDGYGG